MATRLRDAAFEREVRSVIEELRNDPGRHVSISWVQRVIQEHGYVAGLDRVARFLFQIEEEEEKEKLDWQQYKQAVHREVIEAAKSTR